MLAQQVTWLMKLLTVMVVVFNSMKDVDGNMSCHSGVVPGHSWPKPDIKQCASNETKCYMQRVFYSFEIRGCLAPDRYDSCNQRSGPRNITAGLICCCDTPNCNTYQFRMDCYKQFNETNPWPSAAPTQPPKTTPSSSILLTVSCAQTLGTVTLIKIISSFV
uniref:Uncharacterized protein n=1 Tax=Clytia hemisphaerica TaxID=252671 RepID=A0A7M5WSH0_9CNID|eukprot:TCONS_00016877-protein